MLTRLILLILIFISACALLIFPNLSAAAVDRGLQICASAIIPSLFPFLTLTNLFIALGYDKPLSRAGNKIMQALFHLPGAASPALIMGSICGFPAGARTAVSLYESKALSKAETEQLLLFCSNAGPAFIFGVIGQAVFGSAAIGFYLWFIHLTAAFMTGIIFRPRKIPQQLSCTSKTATHCTADSFINAIIEAGSDTMRICMFILLFSIITAFIEAPLSADFRAGIWYPLLFGFIELSGAAPLFQLVDSHVAFIFLSALLGWNGCCVHMQVLSVCSERKLSLKKYFYGKAVHVLLSLILSSAAAALLRI